MGRFQKIVEIVYDRKDNTVKYALLKKDASAVELLGSLDIVKHKILSRYIAEHEDSSATKSSSGKHDQEKPPIVPAKESRRQRKRRLKEEKRIARDTLSASNYETDWSDSS